MSAFGRGGSSGSSGNQTQFSAKKIAKGIVKANINFWGGQTAPYLNGIADSMFDFKSVLDKFKIPMSQRNRIIQSQNSLNSAINEKGQAEVKCVQEFTTFRSLLVTLQSASLQLYFAGDSISVNPFSNSYIYSINRVLVQPNTPYNVGNFRFIQFKDVNSLYKNNSELKQYITQYLRLVDAIKKCERSLLMEKNKLNEINRRILNIQNEYNRIMNPTNI